MATLLLGLNDLRAPGSWALLKYQALFANFPMRMRWISRKALAISASRPTVVASSRMRGRAARRYWMRLSSICEAAGGFVSLRADVTGGDDGFLCGGQAGAHGASVMAKARASSPLAPTPAKEPPHE